MYYYLENEEIKKLKNTDAEAKVKRSRLVRTKKTTTLPDGTKSDYWERDVVTDELPYINTIASNFTKVAPPTITKKQRLSISESNEWVVTDLTEEEKEVLCNAEYERVDRETNTAIGEGFYYDNHLFSMSEEAQLNWLGLYSKHNAGLSEESTILSTKDNKDYRIKKDKITEFLNVYFDTKESILDTGRKRKEEIRAEYYN